MSFMNIRYKIKMIEKQVKQVENDNIQNNTQQHQPQPSAGQAGFPYTY